MLIIGKFQISHVYHISCKIWKIEYFVSGSKGRITSDITANFKVLLSSSLDTFSFNLFKNSFSDNINDINIVRITANFSIHNTTNVHKKYVRNTDISVVIQSCFSLKTE